jgi:hypothetical protein
MKTNKIFIASAVLVLVLAACSEQADFNQADVINAAVEKADVPVQFDTYMGSARSNTRAYLGSYNGGTIGNNTDNGKTQLKTVGFGVFAYFSGTENFTTWSGWNLGTDPYTQVSSKTPNFMYNERLTWSASNPTNQWVYSPVKYWPNGVDAANTANDPSNTAKEKDVQQKLSFFAYAPYVSVTTTQYPTTPGESLPTSVTSGESGNVVTTGESKGIVAMSKNSAQNDMWVKYVLGSEAVESSVIDLLWGLRGQKSYQETDGSNNTITDLGLVYNTDLTKQTVQEKVRFLFKHALAKVGGATQTSAGTESDPAQCGLKVVLDVDANSTNPLTGSDDQKTFFPASFDPTRTIVLIKDVNIRDKYTYTTEGGVSDGITDEASDLATFGWFDIMAGKWSNIGTTAALPSTPGPTYSVVADKTPSASPKKYSLNTAIKDVTIAAGNVETNTEEATYGQWKDLPTGVEGVLPTKLQNVYADENVPALLVIPGSGTDVNNTLYVTVEYVVRTADPKLDGKFTEVTQTITNAVQLGSSMEANKYYTLVMHLGLTSVKFEAIVADWSNDDGTKYDENGNPIPGDNENATNSVWLPSNVITASTSTSVSAGNSTGVIAAANATTYTINIEKANGSSTLTAGIFTNEACTDAASSAYKTVVSGGTVTVTLAPNTTAEKKKVYVKVTDNNGTAGDESDDKVSVITITQQAAALTLGATGTVNSTVDTDLTTVGNKLDAGETTFKLIVKDGGSNAIDLTANAPTITVESTGGTAATCTPSAGDASGNVTITLSATNSSTTEDRTITIKVKVKDAPETTLTITQSKATT